jgi:hypothetical protein
MINRLTKLVESVNLLSGSFSFHKPILPLGGWCRKGTSHLTFCLKSNLCPTQKSLIFPPYLGTAIRAQMPFAPKNQQSQVGLVICEDC